MKRKLAIGTLLLVLAGAITAAFSIDGRRRQSDINMISGVANSFFERDYPQFQVTEKDTVVRFPIEKCSDLFVRKIISANFPEPILMLNLPYDSYIKASRETTAGSIGVPLVWARRTGFGRSYYVYWGLDKNGVATEADLTQFIESRAKSPEKGQVKSE